MGEVEELLTKKVADRYLKREVLGEGTYGVVFKAIDTKVPYLSTFQNCKFLCFLFTFVFLLRIFCFTQTGRFDLFLL